MGRSPCCSKEGLNRGAWTSQEDIILSEYIRIHGDGRWRNLPQKAGLKRCGKSCRLRWRNYLCPGIKRGNISPEEEDLIIRLHRLLGNRWALIAGRLPERTDNEIKNYWTTHLSKKLFQSQPNSIKNGFNGYGCSNGNSHDGFKSFNVKETKNSWRSSCDIPVRDSIITYDDSEPIAREGRNTTSSMSRLVDERSPLFDYDYFADAPTLAESLLDLNQLSSPSCNLLSSPSKSCAGFGLEEFYTEPATLGGKAIEFEVMCSDEFNMQRVNSFTFGDDEWLQEDLCSSAKLVDWIHELDYIQ